MNATVPTVQACPHCARMQELMNQSGNVADAFRRMADDHRRQLDQVQLFFDFLMQEIKQQLNDSRRDEMHLMRKTG